MSTSKGSYNRTRPQKHQNKTSFKNDLHDKSHKTKFLNSLEISGVCKRCKDIIDWKIKYKKYKPLTVPGKCVACEERTIKYAYHVLCTKCATEKKVCAKCRTPIEQKETEQQEQSNQNIDLQSMLKELPERKRRSILRAMNKSQNENKITPEMKEQIEDMLQKNNKGNLNDEDFDDFSFEDSDESDYDD